MRRQGQAAARDQAQAAQRSIPPGITASVQLVLSFALLAAGAMVLGDSVRGSASPWLWRELRNPRHVPDRRDVIVATAMYGAFYLLGFFVPYWLTTFVLFMGRFDPARGAAETPVISAVHRTGRLFVSLAGLVIYLVFLEPVVAFLRAVPWDVWNGWLLILGIALAGFFAFAAYAVFTGSKRGNELPGE